jgi:hypothetical protein
VNVVFNRFWDQAGQQYKVDTVILYRLFPGQKRTASARVQTVYGVTLEECNDLGHQSA